MRKLLPVLVLALVSALLVPLSANAASPIGLHHVNLRNRTIPGSTCHRKSAITLHKGHGVGGTFRGEQLVVDAIGKPKFADITGDGRDEAFLFVLCSTGGGTAASEVQSNWVVFTGRSGTVRVLGNIKPKHQWLNSVATIMSDPRVEHGLVRITETIWFPDNPTCCGTGRAHTTWWFHNGELRVKTTQLHITDKIVGTRRVGHARLGDTRKQLEQTYGSIKHASTTAPHCDVYWHGEQRRSFRALIDHSRSNRVFGIYAPPRAVTVAGVGHYATLKQIERVYAGHTIRTGSGPSGNDVLVKLAHSWLGFSMTKPFGSQYLVHSIRLGTKAFVDGRHTCSS